MSTIGADCCRPGGFFRLALPGLSLWERPLGLGGAVRGAVRDTGVVPALLSALATASFGLIRQDCAAGKSGEVFLGLHRGLLRGCGTPSREGSR